MRSALTRVPPLLPAALDGLRHLCVSGLFTIVGTFTDYAGGTWSLLSVELFKLASKAKLINISLQERLLGRAVLEYIGRHNVA